MAVIKFEPNIPQTMAFTYAKGKESPSQTYKNNDGTPVVQWFRKTKAGDSVYLSAFVEDELVGMDYRAGEPVTICKRVQGKTTRWEVFRPGEAPERPLAGQPSSSGSGARATYNAAPGRPVAVPQMTGTPQGTISAIMRNFLKEAVDLTKFTVDYATSQGFPLPADMLEVVQKIAVSLYIQHGKEGNIRRMHDYAEMRGADTDFARAGSQQAADAVAQRKIAEAGPPPAWLEGEDLSFLGDTQRAV